MLGPDHPVPKMEPARAGPPRKTAFLAVHLDTRGGTMSTPGLSEEQTTLDSGDVSEIQSAAKRVANSDPAAKTLAISADPDVSLGRLMNAISAARGGRCTSDGRNCLLTEVHVMRGDVHRFRPIYWPGPGERAVGESTGNKPEVTHP